MIVGYIAEDGPTRLKVDDMVAGPEIGYSSGTHVVSTTWIKFCEMTVVRFKDIKVLWNSHLSEAAAESSLLERPAVLTTFSNLGPP